MILGKRRTCAYYRCEAPYSLPWRFPGRVPGRVSGGVPGTRGPGTGPPAGGSHLSVSSLLPFLFRHGQHNLFRRYLECVGYYTEYPVLDRAIRYYNTEVIQYLTGVSSDTRSVLYYLVHTHNTPSTTHHIRVAARASSTCSRDARGWGAAA